MDTSVRSYSEDEIVRLLAQGDCGTFGYIYELYIDQIYRYIYYRVGDSQEAEDLTEAVFMKAWEALNKGRKNKIKNPKAWLYRIAHNLVVDFYRSNTNVNLSLSEIDHPHQDIHVETIVDNMLESRFLAEAIKRLDDPMQQIIILRFINHLSHAETAEILNLKEGHVRVLQYRALKLLRTFLGQENDE